MWSIKYSCYIKYRLRIKTHELRYPVQDKLENPHPRTSDSSIPVSILTMYGYTDWGIILETCDSDPLEWTKCCESLIVHNSVEQSLS